MRTKTKRERDAIARGADVLLDDARYVLRDKPRALASVEHAPRLRKQGTANDR
jgi:hypothetical protein